MKKEKKIKVCSECEAPLIFTFAFDYCELYCLNCGAKGGMFGTGHEVDLTTELLFKKKLVDSLWRVIYRSGWYLPSGRFGKGGCKKDNKNGRYSSSCENHNEHLTEKEIEKNLVAREYLEKMKGILNQNTHATT